MPITLAQARTLALAYLRHIQRNPGPEQVLGPHQAWDEVAQKLGITLNDGDNHNLLQVFHELYLERIIVAGTGRAGVGSQSISWPFYRITEYGHKVLNSAE
jgi:hypothetical protein